MIRHVLADGRKVESIKGMVVPPAGKTVAVYNIVAEITARRKAGEDSLKGEKQLCESNRFTTHTAAVL